MELFNNWKAETHDIPFSKASDSVAHKVNGHIIVKDI